MDTTAIQEAKIRAKELDSHWAARATRRALYMGIEASGYVLSLALLVAMVMAMNAGHKLVVAEYVDGPTHARTTVEDDRVTLLLYVGYALLFLASVSTFFVARLVRSSRKRRDQVHGLCDAVARI